MKKSDYIKAINGVKEMQLDMFFWDFKSQNINTKKIKRGIKIDLYNSSNVISTRFYKIIRF